MDEKLGWTCWGAAISLVILTIVTQLPLALIPGAAQWTAFIPGLSTSINLEEAGFFSAPSAMLAGGFLGWHLFRTKEHASTRHTDSDR